MIIQCVSCGYLHNIDHNGSAEEIEQRIYETMENGWRFSPNYKGYVCPNCKQDKFHELACGKIRKTTKEKSYFRLLYDICDFVKCLDEIKRMYEVN